MATKKPPKRRTAQQENVYRKLHPELNPVDPDLQEQEDLDDQPATPELIAALGFNPDDDEPTDPEFWE